MRDIEYYLKQLQENYEKEIKIRIDLAVLGKNEEILNLKKQIKSLEDLEDIVSRQKLKEKLHQLTIEHYRSNLEYMQEKTNLSFEQFNTKQYSISSQIKLLEEILGKGE